MASKTEGVIDPRDESEAPAEPPAARDPSRGLLYLTAKGVGRAARGARIGSRWLWKGTGSLLGRAARRMGAGIRRMKKPPGEEGDETAEETGTEAPAEAAAPVEKPKAAPRRAAAAPKVEAEKKAALAEPGLPDLEKMTADVEIGSDETSEPK